MENVTRNFNIYGLVNDVRNGCDDFFDCGVWYFFFCLGYTLGGARERKNKWLMNKILLDELIFIQYDIDRFQEFLIRHFLKDRNNKERNEQQ